MQLLFDIMITALIATVFMTAFSHLMSETFRKLFSEPVLINYVLSLSGIHLDEGKRSIAGWVIHYGIGVLFVLGYYWAWHSGLALTWENGFLLGAASGILGILGWIILFKLPRQLPPVHFTAYYVQLFFAHIVFGISATAAWMLCTS